MDTPASYKEQIMNLLQDSSWQGLYKAPQSRVKEYVLTMPYGTCYADFCYELGSTGKLFIEDDDAARALNNLVKYWEWCISHPDQRPVHLIHIIGEDNGACIDHCKFLKERMERELVRNDFNYHIITIGREWHAPEKWLFKLKEVLTQIAKTS